MKESLVKWTGGMSFAATSDTGHTIVMDARSEVGGEDKGPRPTDLILAAWGGCTGMDVISILKKQRYAVERLEMAVEADSAAEHPRSFTDFRMVYRLWGDVPADKFQRAVELSQTTYCSVGGLLKKGATVGYRLELNGERLDS